MEEPEGLSSFFASNAKHLRDMVKKSKISDGYSLTDLEASITTSAVYSIIVKAIIGVILACGVLMTIWCFRETLAMWAGRVRRAAW
jgi:hypothetical protein